MAAGCILAERLWPATELPRVDAWWGRIILINSIQLGMVILAGQTWNRWMARASFFHARDHFNDFAAAGIAHFISTFIYYCGTGFGTNRSSSGEFAINFITSARRIEIVTSFYKHPVEILLNSILGSAIVYPLLGCSIQAAGYYTALTALAEYLPLEYSDASLARLFRSTPRIASGASPIQTSHEQLR